MEKNSFRLAIQEIVTDLSVLTGTDKSQVSEDVEKDAEVVERIGISAMMIPDRRGGLMRHFMRRLGEMSEEKPNLMRDSDEFDEFREHVESGMFGDPIQILGRLPTLATVMGFMYRINALAEPGNILAIILAKASVECWKQFQELSQAIKQAHGSSIEIGCPICESSTISVSEFEFAKCDCGAVASLCLERDRDTMMTVHLERHMEILEPGMGIKTGVVKIGTIENGPAEGDLLVIVSSPTTADDLREACVKQPVIH